MIKVGSTPQNEAFSIGTDLKFWQKEDPKDYDETTVVDNIECIKIAAKILKCKDTDVLFCEEDEDGGSRFDVVGATHGSSIPKTAIKDSRTKKIGDLLDGQAGLWDLDGIRFITVNSWGYGMTFISRKDAEAVLKRHDSMNESVKIRDMTKAMGQGYEGHWQMPSGKPGQIINVGDFELAMMGDGEGSIQTILMDEDGFVYAKIYPEKDESKAASEFKSMAAAMSDLMDAKKFAKKFGLKGM